MKMTTIKKNKSGINHIPAMNSKKRIFLKRIRYIFNKYQISQSDRSQLHKLIRGVGIIKMHVKNFKDENNA